MERTVWLVDAFTRTPLTGNPAGVVPEASDLSTIQMQAIASELHASETAFVLSSTSGSKADFRLRYFTPASEVDLCGHATVGAIAGLLHAGRLGTGTGEEQGVTGACQVETNVGVLPIRFGWADGLPWVEMGQAAPQFRDNAFDLQTACRMLGTDVAQVDETLPWGMSFTGLWDIFVPLRSLSTVAALDPDLTSLSAWNRELGATSTHVYTRECVDAGHDFHTRDFSPAVGVPEDPATGTATGALMALLRRDGLVQAGETRQFEQGYEIGRNSLIFGRTQGSGDNLAVYVRGTAVVALTGTLRL